MTDLRARLTDQGGVRQLHRWSGEECLVAHFTVDAQTGDRELLLPCRRCLRCGEWIRPERFDQPECQG